MNNLKKLFCLTVVVGAILHCVEIGIAGEKEASPIHRLSREAYSSHVFQKDYIPIRKFLKPRPGDVLYVSFIRNLYKDENAVYVVVYGPSKKKCVLYTFEDKPIVTTATNYGYGVLTEKGEWRINPEDPETGEMFESHGGLFTYERIKEVMRIGLQQGKFLSVTWKDPA